MANEILVQVKLELPVRVEAVEEICDLFLEWLEAEQGLQIAKQTRDGLSHAEVEHGYRELAHEFATEWKARKP